MIDIHSHIIWGVDDGAHTRSDSLAMLKIAAETGTTDIVATPHADTQFTFDAKLVAERIEDLTAATDHVPTIHRGCDFHLSSENVQAAFDNPTQFTINGLSHLMVEFANNLVPPSIDDVFRQLTLAGIMPVITHPERNPILQCAYERLQKWIELGCLVQVTAQCLTDEFGKSAQKSAWTLLRKGLVHVIASDGHDTEHRPPRLDHAREILTAEMGADTASLLLEDNPDAVIRGNRASMRSPSVLRKKKWFLFSS